jgi:hypothetical protein
MLAGDDAGPLERAWRCCGFRILPSEDWDYPEVVESPERLTVMMLPAAWARNPAWRELACGYAISALFAQRYGVLMLQRGITAWPQLVEGMGARDRETAAD